TVGEMSALLARARDTYLSTRGSHQQELATKRGNGQFSFTHYSALRNLALLDLLFATGMRVGEVSALDVPDFLVEEAVFRVHGKGGRYRLACVVDQETVQIQRDHLAARQRFETSSTALFLNISGERLSTQGIANVIAQFRKEAGIERHVT